MEPRERFIQFLNESETTYDEFGDVVIRKFQDIDSFAVAITNVMMEFL